MNESANLLDQLPLSEPTLLILISLAPGPRHGYAILKDVSAASQGRVQLSTGTLYGALARLLEQRWIERVDSPAPDDREGRPRKEYRLTELGRTILKAELQRMKSLLSTARLRAVEA